MIKNITTFASVLQNIRFAKRHQMLGDVCLPPAERGFKMTDASFASANGEQDGDALRRGNCCQWHSDLFGNLRDGLFFHIHKSECIV